MKYLIYCLLCIFLSIVVLTPFVIFMPKTKEVPKLGSIVRMVDEEGDTFCTGTVIAPTLIVTAAHCILVEVPGLGLFPKQQPVEIRARDNHPILVYATFLAARPQLDQALLVGDFNEFDVRPYITNPEELGKLRVKDTKFISCGYPFHGDLYCNEVYYDHSFVFFWAVDGVIIPGMSGGPTMLPDGTVIAVNNAARDEYSIISPIYNLLEGLR